MTETRKAIIERLKGLDVKRKPGAWRADGYYVELGKNGTIYDEGGHSEDDAEFIAAAPTMMTVIDVQERLLTLARDVLTDLLELHEDEPARPAVRHARETLAALNDDQPLHVEDK